VEKFQITKLSFVRHKREYSHLSQAKASPDKTKGDALISEERHHTPAELSNEDMTAEY
jgi:hypothetical protein